MLVLVYRHYFVKLIICALAIPVGTTFGSPFWTTLVWAQSPTMWNLLHMGETYLMQFDRLWTFCKFWEAPCLEKFDCGIWPLCKKKFTPHLPKNCVKAWKGCLPFPFRPGVFPPGKLQGLMPGQGPKSEMASATFVEKTLYFYAGQGVTGPKLCLVLGDGL